MSSFKKAERFLTNPTIALTGPTGSGKTFSGLRLATGIAKAMGKRFAVIDTENGSASLYSHLFDFDTLNITPPFTTEKYINAINEAEKENYCAVLCDSITHAWAGEGGLLEQKSLLDTRPNSNHWANWNPIKTKDLRFKNAYLHSTIPFFIATMRSKMEYKQSETGSKAKIERVGLAPVQSDGIEYEFSIVFDIAGDHQCGVSKDRTHMFDQSPIFQITEDTGKLLVDWRNEGKEKPKAAPVSIPNRAPNAHPPVENQSFQPDDIDDIDKHLGAPAVVVNEAGNYMITFGQFKGWKLADIEEQKLRDYLNFIQDESVAKNKTIDPNGAVGILFAKAEVWLGVE